MAMLLLPWLSWLIVSFLAVYLLNLLTHSRRGLPPGPRPLPFIGSLNLLGNQPHRSLARLARTHGPLMSLRLGSVTTVVVSSPDAAREFLQRHEAVFANRSVPDALLRSHAKHSVAWLPNDDPQWRALRKLMGAELFAPHRLDALRHLRRAKVQELVDYVGHLAREDRAVNVGRVAFVTSLNLVLRTIFSRDMASLDDDDHHHHGGAMSRREFFQEVVTDIMEAAGSPNVSDFFPALAPADLQGWRRRMERLFARLHEIFDQVIDQRLRDHQAGVPRNNDFLDLLLDAAERGDTTATRLDRDTLRSLFTDLFTAGSDTSSNTVEWAMAELLQNPSTMAIARDELERVLGSKEDIEESDIGQLPYLQAVIKETFRLHPPAPLLLPRDARVETKIMGHTIPKGSLVFINVWAMGRDAQVWPDQTEKFMPERFLGRTVDFRGGDFDLIPFGGGRRICPGLPLANRMVHLLLASLLNKFRWKVPDDADQRNRSIDMTEKFGVTLAKAMPLYAIASSI